MSSISVYALIETDDQFIHQFLVREMFFVVSAPTRAHGRPHRLGLGVECPDGTRQRGTVLCRHGHACAGLVNHFRPGTIQTSSTSQR